MLAEHTPGRVRREWALASVTTGSPSSSKGSVAQIIASTANDCHLLVVSAQGYASAGTASQASLDILLGASTEDLLIGDLLVGQNVGIFYVFPVFIPAGTRIAAKAAGARTNTAMNIGVELINFPFGPPFRVGSRVVTYGMGTVPDGTAITPGTSGSQGSHTQITASTSEDHFALVPGFQVSGDSTMTISRLRAAIGVGAATEDEVLQRAECAIVDAETAGGVFFPVWQNVPSGTRLTMALTNSVASNDAGYNGCIYGVS